LGYLKLDAIIRQDDHLGEAVDNFLELCIAKYELCVTHLREYKRIWTEEILPRQEEQKKAWRPTPFQWSNPYGPTTLSAKLATLKALVSTSSP
jgi:hypothetical protein